MGVPRFFLQIHSLKGYDAPLPRGDVDYLADKDLPGISDRPGIYSQSRQCRKTTEQPNGHQTQKEVQD